ncbi:MAG TPA: phage major capsid protein [Mycobacterium sp.]|uniref:phage major capsid protein n=1 Tax=Mycobacterium sp. TaxID=1785 RepID=UPI002F42BF7A
MQAIHERFEQLAGKPKMGRADGIEQQELGKEFDELHRHVEKLDRCEVIAGAARGRGGALRIERGSQEESRAPQHRDGAMRTLDGLVGSNMLPARAAETVEALTKTGSRMEQSWAQRMVEATGDEAYLRAFCKVMADSERGHLLWDAKEQEAFQRVQSLRQEMRSMNSTDDQGGFLAPVVIDPSIQISSAGSINPIRQLARNVQTISDSWKGITSAGVTAHWLPEEAEVSDDSPTLAEETIPVWKAAAFVPASFEIIQDGTNFVSEVSKLLLDGLDQLTATAFTTGSGTGQPTGIISALAGGGSVVATATADTLVPGDVYNQQNQLPPRFQAAAQWAANLSIINTLSQFQTANGSLTFPSLQNTPRTLLGRPVSEISNMDGTLGGGAGNDSVVVYGDWSQFVIVDRWPSALEVVPHLFGPNRRPTGQRGFLLYSRVGSDVLVDNAFRVLTA